MTHQERERMNAATHEAAHAVVALSVGRRFRAIELFSDADAPGVVTADGTRALSCGRIWPEDNLIRWEEITDDILMRMAGPAATKRRTHESWLAILLFGSGKSDYESAVESASDPYWCEDPKEYVWAFRPQATKLVKTHWDKITRVADALVARGYLSYDEVQAIYAA